MKGKITKEHVDAILIKSEVIVQGAFGKATIVSVKLPNGFVITEDCACVDPARYDEALGRKRAVAKVRRKIWELEGYRLQCEMADEKGAIGQAGRTNEAEKPLGGGIVCPECRFRFKNGVSYGYVCANPACPIGFGGSLC